MEYLLNRIQEFKESKLAKKLSNEELDVFCRNAFDFGEKTAKYFDINPKDIFKEIFPKQLYQYQMINENKKIFKHKKQKLTGAFFGTHYSTIIHNYNVIDSKKNLKIYSADGKEELTPEAKQIKKALEFFDSNGQTGIKTYKEQFNEMFSSVYEKALRLLKDGGDLDKKSREHKLAFIHQIISYVLVKKSLEQFGVPNYSLMQNHFKDTSISTLTRNYYLINGKKNLYEINKKLSLFN